MPENRDGQSSMDKSVNEEATPGQRGVDQCQGVKEQLAQIAQSGNMEKLVEALKKAIQMKCITEQEAQQIAQQAQGGGK